MDSFTPPPVETEAEPSDLMAAMLAKALATRNQKMAQSSSEEDDDNDNGFRDNDDNQDDW